MCGHQPNYLFDQYTLTQLGGGCDLRKVSKFEAMVKLSWLPSLNWLITDNDEGIAIILEH